MASVVGLNTGGTIQSKIFNDALSSSCSYGNVREKVIQGTIAANAAVLLQDVCKLKAPDAIMIEVNLVVFATDGTNSSQIITLYNSVGQLVPNGPMTISAITNDVLIVFNNGVVGPTPLVQILPGVDAANNSATYQFATIAGTQQRPVRFTATFRQYSSVSY